MAYESSKWEHDGTQTSLGFQSNGWDWNIATTYGNQDLTFGTEILQELPRIPQLKFVQCL